MYEQTVNVEKINEHLLTYVKNEILSELRDIDGISTELEDDYRSYFTLACSDTYRFQLSRRLTLAVTETLSLGYKNVYVRKLLNVDDANFFQNVLVNIICIFDNEYDKQLVSRLINSEQTLCIDGYYNFKMSAIKKKWLEISKLVTDNNFILSDDELITEFLQYLLESMPNKAQEISVTIDGRNFTLYGKNNIVVPTIKSLAKSSSVEEEAFLNIFCLKPERVKIYYRQKPSIDFCSTLDTVFPTQFVVVE